METKALKKRVQEIPALTEPEEVLAVMEDVTFLVSFARELKSQMEEFLIDWINTYGEIEMGDKRWYVGTETKKKERDKLHAAEVLLMITDGSIEQFVEVLGSSPFKVGAFRMAIEDFVRRNEGPDATDAEVKKKTKKLFSEVFSVEKVEDLKTGKPKKKLKQVDTRYVKKKGG